MSIKVNNNPSISYNRNTILNKSEKHKKEIVALTSVIGTIIPMAILAKKQNKNIFDISYELKEMLIVGTGSIAGGLAGGIYSDKGKNTINKIKEANYQLIANLIVPTVLVAQLLKLSENIKFCPKLTKASSVVSGVALGLIAGSFIANKINDFIKKDSCYKRNIGIKDILFHVDDLPVALTLSKIPYVEKVLPFVFAMSGYSAGTKSD